MVNIIGYCGMLISPIFLRIHPCNVNKMALLLLSFLKDHLKSESISVTDNIPLVRLESQHIFVK